MSISPTSIGSNIAIHLNRFSSCVPVLSSITGVVDLVVKAALLKNHCSPSNEYLSYIEKKSWKICALQCLPIAGNLYAFISFLTLFLQERERPQMHRLLSDSTSTLEGSAPQRGSCDELDQPVPHPENLPICLFPDDESSVSRKSYDELDQDVPYPDEALPISLFLDDAPLASRESSDKLYQDVPASDKAPPVSPPIDNQALIPSTRQDESRGSILKARNDVLQRLPRGTIQEQALASALKCAREQIRTPGIWREGGRIRDKRKNLAQINRRILPRVPKFTDVIQATDVAKVLIGAADDKSTLSLLQHTLSFNQFITLSEKAGKKELTIGELDAVLKEVFGGNERMLITFKAFLVILKETSEHADVNRMGINNLAICPLNTLLQRNITDPSNLFNSQNPFLAAFLIENADGLLVDV